MVQRFRRQIAVLWVGLLAACPLSGHEPPQTTTGSVPMEPATVSPWLDEVRAQRRAREERRRAAKEAMDARRRWIDPWGAAQQEAREQEVQRRRGAFLEQIERDREAFRNQVPWAPAPQQSPWLNEMLTREPELTAPGEAETAGATGPAVPPPSTPYAPPGWDNLWYYRGY